MSNSIDYFRDKADQRELAAELWTAVAEANAMAAEYTTGDEAAEFRAKAEEAANTARRLEDDVRKQRKAIAIALHPSSLPPCDRPLDEHCPEHDDPPHTRHVVQPEASPMGDVRNHPVPCRGIHDLRDRPMTLNHSALCDRCLNRRPQAWKNRSLSERELIERALDLSESMDDAS